MKKRVAEIASSYELQASVPADEALLKVVTIFRELRSGMTLDKKEKVKSPHWGYLYGRSHFSADQQYGAGSKLR